FGRGKPVLDLVPDAEGGESRAAVLAGRHVWAGQRQAAVAQGLADRHAWRDLQLRTGSGRRDQRQAVGEQVAAGTGGDQPLLRDVVHPGDVGGDEAVGRSALLDLAGERRGGGVGEPDRGSGLARVRRARLVQDVLQRGGGEDRQRLRLGGGGA